jgi:hypothetical protein
MSPSSFLFREKLTDAEVGQPIDAFSSAVRFLKPSPETSLFRIGVDYVA